MDWTRPQARPRICLEYWFKTIAELLQLIPSAGLQNQCKDFGDGSPLALETVFDAPIQELEYLALRLRNVLVPTTAPNQEIDLTILDQLASA